MKDCSALVPKMCHRLIEARFVIAPVVAVLMLGGGCASSRMTADGRRAENIPLRSMAHNTHSPELGHVYVHKGGRTMQIVQALDGGVLVHPVVGTMELEWRGMAAVNDKMTIFIETPRNYVDDEYLQEGLYEYVGTYTYTSVRNARATVRRFREVKQATDSSSN